MDNKRKFAMVDNSKPHKKQFIGEEDTANLLEKYTPMTVLTLLREVSEVEDVKIDWQALVNKTSTGISNAREYQMLWRHLAYRNALEDRVDDASQPLDDDSDLECEVEPVPPTTSEALAEAAAYVKVLRESGPSNDPNCLKVEGPLIINIPKGQTLKAAANSNPINNTQGMSITVPVWVQKKPASSNTNNEILDSNGVGTSGTANLTRRKQKFWTSLKDQELITAVHKYGEGNWANMLEFKGDRSALQLSQRWAYIRKQQGNLNVGNSSQLSEAQLAARHAMSMALDNRPKLNARSGIETSRMASQSQSTPPSQHDVAPTSRVGALAMQKSRLATERLSSKPDISLDPDSKVKAAAIAAGARIATPSDNAQSNNVAHIVPGGSSLRSPIAGIGNSLPGNVHFIRTGLVTKPLSSCSPSSIRKTSIPLSQSSLAVTSSEPASLGGKGKNLFKPQSSLAVTSSDPASLGGKGKSLFNPQSSLVVTSSEHASSGGRGKTLFKPQSNLVVTSSEPASSGGKGKGLFKQVAETD